MNAQEAAIKLPCCLLTIVHLSYLSGVPITIHQRAERFSVYWNENYQTNSVRVINHGYMYVWHDVQTINVKDI